MTYTPTAEETKAIHWYVSEKLAGQNKPGAAHIIQHELLRDPNAEERISRIVTDYKHANPVERGIGRV